MGRLPRVQDFSSYARLIRPHMEFDGKWMGSFNKKIGNARFKWAINEAAILMLRDKDAMNYVSKLGRKYNKVKCSFLLDRIKP